MRTLVRTGRDLGPFSIMAHALWRGNDPLIGALVGLSYYDVFEADPFAPSVDLRFNVHLVVLSLQLSFIINLPSK